jgi:hypothetical protein
MEFFITSEASVAAPANDKKIPRAYPKINLMARKSPQVCSLKPETNTVEAFAGLLHRYCRNGICSKLAVRQYSLLGGINNGKQIPKFWTQIGVWFG